MNDVLEQLRRLSVAPAADDDFAIWLQFPDAVAFLEANTQHERFVLYASLSHVFLHAILVPQASADPPDAEDLRSWNCTPGSSWGIMQTFHPPTVSVSPPLTHTGSRTLDQGEQLIFLRHFEGHPRDERSYFEILQKFVHVADLHFVSERCAYCRVDENGDIEDVIRIVRDPTPSGGTIITVQRDVLDEYMALTESVAARTFDFTRFRMGSFGGWPNSGQPSTSALHDLYYRSVIFPRYGSYMRGVQVVRPTVSKAMIAQRLNSGDRGERQYASFIAQDFKNGRVDEISCAPEATANYFTESPLPYEMSPAFFRPEVLAKYKADSDKYRLEEGSVSCRGAWHLETYGINDAGQVHTYIVYLRSLPYAEQLHWKAHNEPPKAPISKSALKTDFEGSWDLDYEPLRSLKEEARDLARRRVPWWTLRSEKALDQLQYPVTASADEWANELLHLDQLLVEGLEEKWLRKTAASMGRAPDARSRSLALLEECLVGLGFDAERAAEMTAPLRDVHHLRSKVKGHASGEEAARIRRSVLAEHKTYAQHFRALCQRCDERIREMDQALNDPGAS